ncbi:hypothetical protein VTK73DRAFT_9777 [Phialemonium thermophilum]|uniref:Uncharacterized protein n=1 Tax=Phialemonium thermophilum TaxID=223376 RepID=A0ABR3W0E3_9PEZI
MSLPAHLPEHCDGHRGGSALSAGEGLQIGAIYAVDVVKRDGEKGIWKITTWKFKLIWTKGTWMWSGYSRTALDATWFVTYQLLHEQSEVEGLAPLHWHRTDAELVQKCRIAAPVPEQVVETLALSQF